MHSNLRVKLANLERTIQPFGRAKLHFWRWDGQARLRVNLESLGLSSGRRQAPAIDSASSPSLEPSRAKSMGRLGSRKVH